MEKVEMQSEPKFLEDLNLWLAKNLQVLSRLFKYLAGKNVELLGRVFSWKHIVLSKLVRKLEPNIRIYA
jgi:dsDNA-binding SOS-regulon protein